MPDQHYAQKGPINGGDDDSSGSALPSDQPTKPDLRKYIHKQDINVRQLFWDIVKLYEAKDEKVKEQLKNFQSDRTSLVRIGVSIVKAPERYMLEDMTPEKVACHTLDMIFDANWADAFARLITETYDRKNGVMPQFVVALQKICEKKENVDKFVDYVGEMLLDDLSVEGALAYIAELNSIEVARTLKNELMILAVEGIDYAQHYALFAIAPLVKEDEKIKQSLIKLLNSWDDETRRITAGILKDVKNKELGDYAKKMLDREDNPEAKKMLEYIIKNNEEGGRAGSGQQPTDHPTTQ
jgi:hypothetical protein